MEENKIRKDPNRESNYGTISGEITDSRLEKRFLDSPQKAPRIKLAENKTKRTKKEDKNLLHNTEELLIEITKLKWSSQKTITTSYWPDYWKN